MKKILSISCLVLSMLFSKAYSQSNLTLTIKDNVQKGFFQSATTFHTHFSGFASKPESDAFFKKVKSHIEVLSLTPANVDATGNCDAVLVMKETHNKQYYISFAQKLGVQFIEVNGDKKTPAQFNEEARKK